MNLLLRPFSACALLFAAFSLTAGCVDSSGRGEETRSADPSEVSSGGMDSSGGAGTGASGGKTPAAVVSLGGATASEEIEGDAGAMRDISSLQIVEDMFVGWNLGNTLDADDHEMAWGNPKTTQEMIDAVHAAGFNTVRVPVTWHHHMGGAPHFAVEEAWMARVEEVVGYVLKKDMYAILNTHHEEWLSVMPNANHDELETRLAVLWTQIARRFRNYGDHLILETLNEPRTTDNTEWIGGTPHARGVINRYNLAAVNAIRATGGNNSTRHLMVPTHAANANTEVIRDLVVPNDDPHIIISLHTYYPYELSLGAGSDWGSDSDISQMSRELDRIYELLPAKGRAVVIGEWGSQHRDNTSVRAAHAETYARLVRERGMCSVWWDNGSLRRGADGFGLLDRRASPPEWRFDEISTSLIDGAKAGAEAAE